jgi:hypothetical protein
LTRCRVWRRHRKRVRGHIFQFVWLWIPLWLTRSSVGRRGAMGRIRFL